MLQSDPIQGAQPYFADEDRIAARRLSSLLEYVQALVKLDERVATSLSQHKLADGSKFALHEHELRGLPGVTSTFPTQMGRFGSASNGYSA